MIRQLSLVLLIVGCGSSSPAARVPAGASVPTPAPAPSSAPGSAAAAIPGGRTVHGCIANEATHAACDAQGAAFRYQPDPPRNCRGVRRENEHEDEPPEPPKPCVCIEVAEASRLEKRCREAR